jgi:hypothetical protein
MTTTEIIYYCLKGSDINTPVTEDWIVTEIMKIQGYNLSTATREFNIALSAISDESVDFIALHASTPVLTLSGSYQRFIPCLYLVTQAIETIEVARTPQASPLEVAEVTPQDKIVTQAIARFNEWLSKGMPDRHENMLWASVPSLDCREWGIDEGERVHEIVFEFWHDSMHYRAESHLPSSEVVKCVDLSALFFAGNPVIVGI